MYRISEFSKITNLTVKTLRYYDDEGILVPSRRDELNSYRYYTGDDFERAKLIVLLRELNFSIAEMKDVLSSYESESDLSYYLEEKKRQIEAAIRKDRELIRKISLHINPQQGEKPAMHYEVETREFPAVTVASIRFKGAYPDIGKYIGSIYKAVKGNGAGMPFSLYYDEDFKEQADIEICVPVKHMVEGRDITVRKLPAIRAICTVHRGAYGSLNLAYKTLTDYARDNNLQMKSPSREVYIKGPGMIFKGNEENYITEIYIPVEEV